jgi:hypothetical protein
VSTNVSKSKGRLYILDRLSKSYLIIPGIKDDHNQHPR